MADDDDYKKLQERLNQLLAAGSKGAQDKGKLTDDSLVYTGSLGRPAGLTGVWGAGTDLALSYGNARLAPRDWTNDQKRSFVNNGIMNKIPGFDVNMGLPEIMTAWDTFLQQSFTLNQGLKKGQKRWTPQDIMDTYSNSKGKFGTIQKGDWVYDVATGERIKYTGPRTKTTKDKKFDLSSPEDVKVLTTQMLRELLGRAPNEKELAQFKSSVNTYEKANPLVTTTTATLTPNMETGEVEASDQTSTTTGGVSDAARASLISDQETDTKEYGKYQAATTYWDAMMQMIGGGA